MAGPEERLMGWVKSACHLESTCTTAWSKWRLSFPREFSQRDIKMVYDPASVFRPQSFHQFLFIAMEENCFGASLLGRYLGVIFKGTATQHSVIKLLFVTTDLEDSYFLPCLRISVGDDQCPGFDWKHSVLKGASPCQVMGIPTFKLITLTRQRKNKPLWF